MKLLQEGVMFSAEDLVALDKTEKAAVASGYRQGLLVGVLLGCIASVGTLKLLGMI